MLKVVEEPSYQGLIDKWTITTVQIYTFLQLRYLYELQLYRLKKALH